MALLTRRAAGRRPRRHRADLLGAGRRARGGRDRPPRAWRSRRRRAIRRDGGVAARAPHLPGAARARLRPRRRARLVRTGHAGVPIRQAAPSWRCSPVPTRACRRAASPSTSRSVRSRTDSYRDRDRYWDRPQRRSPGACQFSSRCSAGDLCRRCRRGARAARAARGGSRAYRRGAGPLRTRRLTRRRRHTARAMAVGGTARRGLCHQGPGAVAAPPARASQRVRSPLARAGRRRPRLATPARARARSRAARTPRGFRATGRGRARPVARAAHVGRLDSRVRDARAASAATAGPSRSRARRDGSARKRRSRLAARGARRSHAASSHAHARTAAATARPRVHRHAAGRARPHLLGRVRARNGRAPLPAAPPRRRAAARCSSRGARFGAGRV